MDSRNHPGTALYVHPYNHSFDGVVSNGGIALMNRLPGPKVGRYAQEVTGDDIRDAAVVLVEAHWSQSLGALDGIVSGIRRVRQDVPIIAGGLTAAFYGELFRQRFGFDYVVGGDGNLSLPELVETLRHGGTPRRLPGICDGRGDPLPASPLTSLELDGLDWLTVDWFPSLRQRTAAAHAAWRINPDTADAFGHPILLTSRGCVRRCEFCVGAYQDHVFGPRRVVRSARALVRDLERLEADPDMSFVSLVFGDVSNLARLAPAIRGRASRLGACVYVCGRLDESLVRDLESAFLGEVRFAVLLPGSLEPLNGKVQGRFDDVEVVRTLVDWSLRGRAKGAAFYMGAKPRGLCGIAERSGGLVQVYSGAEWRILQPDQMTLEVATPEGQLASLEKAARMASAGFLLSRLVPNLRGVPVTCPSMQNPGYSRDRVMDRLIRESERTIFENRAYGFESLEIAWTALDVPDGFSSGWCHPGRPIPGTGTWGPGLNGYEWQGEVEVLNERTLGIGLTPVVVNRGRRIAISDWSEAQVATVAIRPGPSRILAISGRTLALGIEVMVTDQGSTQRFLLPRAPEKQDSKKAPRGPRKSEGDPERRLPQGPDRAPEKRSLPAGTSDGSSFC